jgi:hypothetical protein
MGFLDRLLGREGPDPYDRREESEPSQRDAEASVGDERALERYRYLVQTAPPERIEQAHEEAFAKLTPDQRRLALEQLSRQVPDESPRGDDPRSLARLATRAEVRRPGTVARSRPPSWGRWRPRRCSPTSLTASPSTAHRTPTPTPATSVATTAVGTSAAATSEPGPAARSRRDGESLRRRLKGPRPQSSLCGASRGRPRRGLRRLR